VKAKVCKFCADKTEEFDYKDTGLVRRYVSVRGKILPSKLTGVCMKHQRYLTRAIKRARFMGFLPFVQV